MHSAVIHVIRALVAGAVSQGTPMPGEAGDHSDNALWHGLMFAASFGVALVALWIFFNYWTRHRRVSWAVVMRCAKSLAEEMKADDFTPTLIVGIGHGGAVFAALIGSYFRDPLVIVTKRGEKHRRKSERESQDPAATRLSVALDVLDKTAEEKNILLVVDSAYTGTSFEGYREAFMARGFPHVRTFAYAVHPEAQHLTDYKVLETRNRIYFPWREASKRHRD